MENTECKSLGSNSKSMRSIKINLQLSILSCSLSDPPEKLTYKGNDGTVGTTQRKNLKIQRKFHEKIKKQKMHF